MKLSRLAVPAVAALLIAACAKDDKAAADSAAAAQQATPAPPPPFSLVAAAGKWQMTSTPMSGPDTVSNKYVLTATADTTGWSITFPSGLKVPLRVTVSGDSILMKSGTYASQRRKGVQVMTESSGRMQGGQWVGTSTAHYKSAKDSVIQFRITGSKTP